MVQKMRWLIMPWVVMPTLSGMWLGMSRYEGQMARIIWVMAVEPVYVWMACQNKAVMARVTMANFEKCQPNEARMATGKGMWRRAPTMPLRTRGTVQTRLPKMMQTTASRLVWVSVCLVPGILVGTDHVRPMAMMEAGAIQL